MPVEIDHIPVYNKRINGMYTVYQIWIAYRYNSIPLKNLQGCKFNHEIDISMQIGRFRNLYSNLKAHTNMHELLWLRFSLMKIKEF